MNLINSRLALFCSLFICSFFFVRGQGLIQLGPKKITAERFTMDYKRLVESDSVRSDNKAKFLNDYLDYQYKILAAEQAGLLTSPGFQEEYQSFRKELASPYLIDNEKVDLLVREAYQRMREEKQVAHILVKLGANPSPGDTLIALQKIENIYKKLKLGEDFSAMALKYSEDTQTSSKGGMLGYISSLQTQYPFETNVYSLALGEFSKPFRTKAGFHIVKLLKSRPNQGKIRLAHILSSVSIDAPTNLQVEAKKKIETVDLYLKNGDSFEEVCKTYSDDPYSRGRGGELRRWYFSSDLSEELQDKLFGLQRLGDISVPIRTNLGWQVFKLLDKKPLLSFEEMAEFIRQKVMSDEERAEIIRQSFMKKVFLENNIAINETNKKVAIDRISIDRIGDEDFLKFKLFTVGGKDYLIKDFYQFVQLQQKRKLKSLGYLPSNSEETYFTEYVESLALQAEEQNLEVKYPAFKEQMQEFLEGTLFSKITEKEIFEPSLDSLNQLNYFQKHIQDFKLPARVYGKFISADSPKTLSDALELLKNAPYPMNKRYPEMQFKLGTTELTGNGVKLIADLSNVLLKNRDYILEISGHRDASENDTIAQARVNFIVSQLKSKGVLSTHLIEKDESALVQASKSDKLKNARVSFKFYSQSMEDVIKRFNSIKPGSLEAKEGYFLPGENSLMDVNAEIGNKTIETGNRKIVVEIKSKEAERLKSLDEARTTIIRNLQIELEKNWLNKLKNQYPAQIQYSELDALMK
ncbi:MAG: Peptidylprolyl isomerase [Bacteroidota bacterium]|jgi:peptidyl-prolyl cis-trans isomerase SurA